MAAAALGTLTAAGLLAARGAGPDQPPSAVTTRPTTTTPPTSTTTSSIQGWPLAAVLDPIWSDTPGGCLRVSAGGRVLYEANPNGPVVPASVTKLFTAAAALRVLGPERALRTTVRTAGEPVAGVVSGDLWLVGGGDPVLGTDAWAAQLDVREPLHTSLDELADEVVAAGVRRIEGRILGDDSRFDADRYVETWPDRLIADGEAGPLSALSVNDGFATWGHPGVPFSDPATDAAAIFTDLLEARGVAVAGSAGSGVAPLGSIELVGIDSPSVGDLVHAMLRDSDNGTAELLVKEVGLQELGAGSTGAGTRVVADTLGVDGDEVVIADGSGLSSAARVTCRALTALLARDAEALSGRLAVAGRDGTLAHRFVGTMATGRLRAKTGSLDGVAALAGYIDAPNGGTLRFAYIINSLPLDDDGRALQDRLVTAIAAATP